MSVVDRMCGLEPDGARCFIQNNESHCNAPQAEFVRNILLSYLYFKAKRSIVWLPNGKLIATGFKKMKAFTAGKFKRFSANYPTC